MVKIEKKRKKNECTGRAAVLWGVCKIRSKKSEKGSGLGAVRKWARIW